MTNDKISVIVLLGKSGAGKDTLASDLYRNYESLTLCVSTTSRPMRINETQGIHYNFVSSEEFLNKIRNSEMIEYRSYETKFNGVDNIWYYGTEKTAIKNGSVLVLDLPGLINLKSALTNVNVKSFYLDCSDQERKRRAQERGSFCEEEWNRRLIDDNIKFDINEIRKHVNYIIDADASSDIVFNNVKKILKLK